MPEHPLSKVRRWLTGVERTLNVAGDLYQDLVEASPPASSATEARHRPSSFAAALLYFEARRLETAERLFTEAVALRNNEPIVDVPRVGQILNLLGVARECLGRGEGAVWAFEWAVRACSATLGDRDAETIRARANVGRMYAALGRHDEAESLLNDVIATLEAERRDSELAVAVNAMGLVRQTQHRHVDALPYFERALALFEN